MDTLKELGATVKGYKGHVTRVVNRLEKANTKLDNSSYQEAQAANDNLNRHLDRGGD